jgi:predicted nucleic acid-binding protein
VIVVSDTSPLNYLVLINAIDLLPKLFDDVYVPPKVIEELQRPKTPDAVRKWALSPPAWLKVTAPKAQIKFTVRLDPGEAHAISLAKEQNATAVPNDEKKGRRVAKSQGLDTVGTITVLELAALKKLLDLGPALHALQNTTFRITSELIRTALDADAARKLAEKNSRGR